MKRLFLTLFILFCIAKPVVASPLETLYGAVSGDSAVVPIIMYHALEDTPDNRWEITEAEFEADLRHLLLLDYTPVVMQNLIDFVHYGKALPQKPIVLSFDDGRQPALNILLHLLEKYNTCITMAIIGSQTDKYTNLASEGHERNFPHMTWDDVENAIKSGRIEIGCHSYDLHGSIGVGKKRVESEIDYRTRFLADLQQFAEVFYQHTLLSANSFTYPLGIFSDLSDEIIKSAGYLASLTCREIPNTIIVGDHDSLFQLGRYNRPPHIDSATFFKNIGID
ncbi:MAG: polysaccharide deacetylase family protein [Defluviitaleaceae bacterium]|nr:polysaccharide deacetylase family protein [Defluviitaleaceae bacterium]